jgi:hypothetical protein
MRLAAILFIIIHAVLSTAAVNAQSANQPLLALPLAQLKFPPIAMTGNGSGSVTVNPLSGATTSTGTIHIFAGSGAPAVVQIIGIPGSLVSVRAASSVQLIAPSGQTVTLQDIISTGQGGVRLNANGLAQIKIGGTLPIASTTTAGVYRGRAVIAVDYVFE